MTISPCQKRAFEAKCTKVLEDFNKWNGTDIKGRLVIGQHLNDLAQAPNHYGNNAVEQVARRVGYSVSTLYNWRNIATTYNQTEIDKLVTTQTQKGAPVINWSHLELLAQLSDDEQRHKWEDAVIQKSLSAKELRRRLEKGVSPESDKETAEKSTDASTLPWLRDMNQAGQSAKSRLENGNKGLTKAIDSNGYDHKTVQEMQKVRHTLQDLRNAIDVVDNEFSKHEREIKNDPVPKANSTKTQDGSGQSSQDEAAPDKAELESETPDHAANDERKEAA
jgi:hypothetical protein